MTCPAAFLSRPMKTVVTRDMLDKIRRMHHRDKKTQRQISRETGLSRNTVANWPDELEPLKPKYQRKADKPNPAKTRPAPAKSPPRRANTGL